MTTESPLPLVGKSIVVVGGTTGLGLAAAKACVAAGARVVLVGRNPDSAREAARQLGSSARACVGDATIPLTVNRAVETCVEAFGRLDGLYHVAGGSGRSQGDGPLHELSDEGIEFTLNLNLNSVIFSNRAAVRQFLAQKGPGAVLNMGSVLGHFPSSRHFATHVYAAAKAAIVGLTRAAASRYAGDRIRFNVLAPALVETPMAQRAANDPQILEFARSKQPLSGGISQPLDLADAAVFFLSDLSRIITGQVLYADGGWSVSEGQSSSS